MERSIALLDLSHVHTRDVDRYVRFKVRRDDDRKFRIPLSLINTGKGDQTMKED